jgi:hypothetical protein
MKRIPIILLIFSCIFYGCVQQQLRPKEYMTWVKNENNGLRVTKQIDDNTFVLQYKPCEFEALLHTMNENITHRQLDSTMKPLQSLQYFTFCIKRLDKKDPAAAAGTDEADYNNRLNYLMFEMQADFKLIDGKDTLPCAFYHYERNYDLSPENNMLLGFELPKEQNVISDKTIIYSDQLLGTGTIQLTIKAEDIKRIPTLNLIP